MRNLIIALLFVFCATYVFAANTTTQTRDLHYISVWEMSFDTTGVQCAFTDGKPYVFVSVDITSGTATYDVESAVNDSPNETGESSDMDSASDLTADQQFIGNMSMPYVCVRVDACSSCAITATIQASGMKVDDI